MTTYFTSDNHYGHKSIISLGRGRPYSTVYEMDENLIVNWNSKVLPDDEIYVLGDFSFRGKPGFIGPIFARLNGKKHLVIGNHDNDEVINLPWSSKPVHYLELSVGGHQKVDRLILSHYPFRSWNGMYRGSLHLHGHTHGNIQNWSMSADVGIDSWNYFPVSLPDIKARIATAPKNPDHT